MNLLQPSMTPKHAVAKQLLNAYYPITFKGHCLYLQMLAR